MVSKSDYLSTLFKNKRGLVEAELIPMFELKELLLLSSLCKQSRSMFDPGSPYHINFSKVIAGKLGIDPTDNKEYEVMRKFNDSVSWLAILKEAAEYSLTLRLMPNTAKNVTYTRFDREYGSKEYLSYTGKNVCAHWNNPQHYHQNCPGVTFGPGKHCNTLVSVCWMDLNGAIEKVQIPK